MYDSLASPGFLEVSYGGRAVGRTAGSIGGMKVSVSLPKEDVDFVDEYAAREGLPSRSSVIHEALRLLRLTELERDYAQAWEEWDNSSDAADWDRTTADGLDASR